MCDTVKYQQIYKDINELTPEDTLQLILETEDPEEKKFYTLVQNYLLSKKQKYVIERNLF